MCEFCNGLIHGSVGKTPGAGDGKPGTDVSSESSEAARLRLSEGAGLGGPQFLAGPEVAQKSDAGVKVAKTPADKGSTPSDKTAKPADKAAPVDPKHALKDKYGVDIHEDKGFYVFSYRADGKDQPVMRMMATEANLKNAGTELDKVVAAKISAMETRYKVKFAKPGEEIGHARIGNDCKSITTGEMVYSKMPTLPQLYALNMGLQSSEPSQLTEDGKSGVKIYLLDKQMDPDFYGGKKVLGTYTTDRDGKPSFFLTPAGLALPPMPKDVPPGQIRNLAWVTAHEITHNSQRNFWYKAAFDSAQMSKDMGWSDHHTLKGKNGELFTNGYASCDEPSFWYAENSLGQPIGKEGKPVAKVADAERLTNEQVQDRALIRPITYYFPNAVEMHSEGLTAYRMGQDSRMKLYRESPNLYKVAETYDKREIETVYGTHWWWKTPNMMRAPDGRIVPNTYANEALVTEFEKKAKQNSFSTDIKAMR